VPVPGHVNPTLPLVRELTGRGHRVRYFISGALEPAVAAVGAETISYGSRIGPEVMRPPRRLSDLAVETAAMGRVVLPLVRDELRRDPPDLLAYDSMCTWGLDAAHALDGPAVCLTATFALDRSFLPADDAPEAFLHRGEHPTIVFSSRAFQPRPELFAGDVEWVGYPPAAAGGAATDGPRPLTYASLGTLFNDRPEVFRAVADGIEGDVLMAVGRADSAALGPLPARVETVPWVDDQPNVLRRARLFVSHGGLNSVSEALVAGTPLLVLPQTAEQAVNARRVEELGAGRVLHDELPSPAAIRAASEEVAASGAAARAAELGATLVGPGPGAAADAIEAAARGA
jgi:UDP:flavonoid glycosyltransferase YjiC (YdhE family)